MEGTLVPGQELETPCFYHLFGQREKNGAVRSVIKQKI